MVIVCSAYWAVISLIDTLEKKKRLRAKNETWGKLNEISEKLKVEKGLKTWKSLSNSNKKKEDVLVMLYISSHLLFFDPSN